jgi:hypothetical protein
MKEYKTIQREQLFALVWSKPTTQVAKELGISDVGLAKICKKLGIPKPGLGYWAKVASGKKPAKGTLPKGDYPSEYRIYPTIKPDEPDWLEEIKVFEEQPENRVLPPATLANPHPWVAKAERKLQQAFKKSQGIVYVCGARMPTMYVSPGTAERALKATQALLDALVSREIKVWIHNQQMLVKVRDETIEIGIRERMKRRYLSQDEKNKITAAQKYQYSWYTPPNFVDEPGGKLQFFLRNAEYFYAYDSRSVGDLENRPTETRVNDFIVALYKMASDIKAIREQRRLEAIEREKQHKIYEDEKRRREILEQQMEKFIGWFQDWKEIRQLRECLSELETHALALPADHEAHQILKLARTRLDKRNVFGSGGLWIQEDAMGHMHYPRHRFW